MASASLSITGERAAVVVMASDLGNLIGRGRFSEPLGTVILGQRPVGALRSSVGSVIRRRGLRKIKMVCG